MSSATNLLQEMLRISSPSGHEEAMADFVARHLAAFGFDVSRSPGGNVVGEIGPVDGVPIMLLGHLDTVPGNIAVRRDGDVVYGRGAVDAKGPLATFIVAAATSPTSARVIVVGAVDEERSSRGARELVSTTAAPAAVVIGEPTGSGGVGIGYKGRLGLTFAVRRPRTHAANPAEKAVEVAVGFWHELQSALGVDTESVDGMFHRVTATLTELCGDLVEATARVDCRIPTDTDLNDLVRSVRAISAAGELTVDELTPGVRRDRSDPVVDALVAAIRRREVRPRLKLKSGTSDMNVIASTWNVPIAAYGPGNSALDHTDDEHISLHEYHEAIDILSDALVTLPSRLPARDGRHG